jgi:hypothetical protein
MDDTGDAADSPSLADDKLYYCMRSANDGRVWVDKDVTRLTHDGFGLSNKNLVEDGYTLCTPRATDSNNKDIGIQEVMLLRDYRGNPSDVYYKGMDFSFTGKTGQNIKCPTEKYWEMATALDGRLWINKDASILNEDSIGSAPEITNLAPVIKKIRAKAK